METGEYGVDGRNVTDRVVMVTLHEGVSVISHQPFMEAKNVTVQVKNILVNVIHTLAQVLKHFDSM